MCVVLASCLCSSHAVISFIVSYSRLLLIAVYSHLLCECRSSCSLTPCLALTHTHFSLAVLDQSHMTVHRFLAVGTALTVWSFELILGDDQEAMRSGGW